MSFSMSRGALAILLVALGCASASPKATPIPKGAAPVSTSRRVPPDVLDIRGIWLDTALDPKGAAARGLDATRIVTPRKLRDVKPIYPEDAKAAGIQGTVTIECIIDVEGDPRECMTTGGPLALREASLTAVRGWRWTPLTVDGALRAALVQLTVKFRLS